MERNDGNQEFNMVFPADLRGAKNLSEIAQNIEGVINVALRENYDYDRGRFPHAVNLRLAEASGGEFIELTVSAKPFQS